MGLKHVTSASRSEGKSYCKVVTSVVAATSEITKKVEYKPPRELVTALPAKEDQTSKETRDILLKSLNPVKEDLKNRNLYGLHNTANRIKSVGLKLEEARRRGPRIMVYGVPRDIDKEAEILETIHSCNFEDYGVSLDTLMSSMTSRMRYSIIEQGKLYIGFSCCRMKDFFEPLRCYKYQRYGHLAVH
ncbi:hypothetical protein PR048_019979 [Dryococelus australis]|uniref:Uncharacterized protein n=1 Tax=Dryococelus australis TaxID=614101 RepID=A0ABQ9H516_9NEOP|nr:hypothetical protein PR048_019979 [Dryococelus australis]